MPFDPDYTQPLVHQGSFGVDYQFQRDAALSVSYLVDRGIHLQRYRDVNLAMPVTPTTISIAGTSTALTFPRFTLPRPSPVSTASCCLRVTPIRFITAWRTLKKRFSQSSNFWLLTHSARSLTTFRAIPLNVPQGDSRLLSDGSNPRVDRRPSVSDQRQSIVLSGLWQLNYATGIVGSCQGPFSVAGSSVQFSRAVWAPYSGLVNFDLNNDGNSATDRTPELGRNTFSLPTTVSLDPRVTRNVQLTERIRGQFIWEAFQRV